MRTFPSPEAANVSIAHPNANYENKLPLRRPTFPIPRVSSDSSNFSASAPDERSPNSALSSTPPLSRKKLPNRTASAAFRAAESTKGSTLPEIAPDAKAARPPQRRRLPNRTASATFRAAESGSGAILPERIHEPADRTERRVLPSRCSSASFRAAEGGKGDLLPTLSARSRTASSNSVADWYNQKPPSQTDTPSTASQSLRSRRPSRFVLDSHDSSNQESKERRPTRDEDYFAFATKTMAKARRKQYTMNKLFLSLQPKGFLQTVAVMAISLLIVDSYHRALLTTGNVARFQQDESMVFLHLDRVEQQVRTLNEQFQQLDVEDLRSMGAKPVALDDDLIKKQMQQLQQMEEELSHEVRALQSSIQVSDRSEIVKKYGEGPVQLVLELDFGNKAPVSGGTRLAVMLWYDTPHAAWKLLQQVEAGLWNGASFAMEKGRSIAAVPTNPDPESSLQFVEQSARNHDPWTVGLSDYGEEGIGIFINLKDNAEYHKHDVCVGKIVDGFDALQQLVSQSRSKASKVVIRSAKASHLTRAQSSSIV